MLIRNLLLTYVLLTAFNANSQNKSTTESHEYFLKSLEAFRYGLYKDFEEKGYDQELSFLQAQDTTSVFYKKCKQFYLEHKNELEAYQQSLLFKHTKTPVALTNYIKDTSFQEVLGQAVTMEQVMTNSYLFRLLTVDPIAYASSVVQMGFVKAKDLEAVTKRSVLSQLAQPRVQTEMLDKDNWKITWDEYNHIFVLLYKHKEQEMAITEVYKRK